MDNLLEALKTGSAFNVGREKRDGKRRTPRAAGGNLCFQFEPFCKKIIFVTPGEVKGKLALFNYRDQFRALKLGYRNFIHYLSLVVRKLVFGVSDQVPHKPGCTAT